MDEISAMDQMIGRLTAIFERVLLHAPIGPEEDFFELGGDSVAAVAISLEIGEALGREVPITAVFAAPSVARLAATLLAAEPAGFSSLVRLRPGHADSGAAPLFLVHGVGGAVTELRDLAARLETGRPVFGVQARGLDGAAPLDRVEDMAGLYLDAMRSLQPAGPYLLGGYSFGGLVAFEMAQRLTAAGEAVSLLVMIDSLIDRQHIGAAMRARMLLRRAGQHAAAFRRLTPGQRWGFLVGRARGLRDEFRPRHSGYLRNLGRGGDGLPEAVRRVRDACRIAGAAYRPRRYGGAVTLIAARDGTDDLPGFPDIVWGRLARSLHLYRLPGDHWSLVKADVAGVAARLSLCLAGLDPAGLDRLR